MFSGKNRLNSASWLTLSRMFLLPVAVLPVALGWRCGWLVCAGVASVAGLTDILDGYVARRKRETTRMGTNLDLLSDKVFVVGMLVFLAAWGLVHAWVPVLVLGREIGVSALRVFRFRSRTPAPSPLGKAKTAASIIAIVWVLLWKDIQTGGVLAAVPGTGLTALLALAPWAMLLAVLLTLISGADYVVRYARVEGS